MLINHNREKLLNAIIFFLKNTKYCGITKLCKLLYYLDFMHFRETGRSVTGLDYFAWDFGPVPQTLYFELKNPSQELKAHIRKVLVSESGFEKLLPLKEFSNKHFCKRELKILQDIVYIFKDAKAKDITDASHLPNHPWDKTIKEKGEKKRIDYLLAIDNTEKSLNMEEAMQIIKEREQIIKAFNE